MGGIWALSFGFTFGGMTRVANTSSMLWEVYFSLRESLGTVGAKLTPWTGTSLTSPNLVVSSACSLPSEEVSAAKGALGGHPWTSLASEGDGSALESEELARHMASG